MDIVAVAVIFGTTAPEESYLTFTEGAVVYPVPPLVGVIGVGMLPLTPANCISTKAP